MLAPRPSAAPTGSAGGPDRGEGGPAAAAGSAPGSGGGPVPGGSRASFTPPSVALPSISLPTGGGAIRGIGEKFAANPVTGTGSMSVPIATSPGRSGFGPQLALSYDSGGGNGPFGFGWSLSLPAVTRKTDKGLPRYDDAGQSDVFLLSAAEDLVPVRDPAQDWARRSEVVGEFRIDRYRPRTEGLFARIERWTRRSDGDIHWRSISRDNVTTVYGEDASSRIADPAEPARVFSWLVCRSHDDKGNAIRYEYVADNDDGVDVGAAHERHRGAAVRGTNRYLKRIRYGNRVSRLVDPDLVDPEWMFEVVLDYGDHDPDVPVPAPDRPWPCRPDPFSSYRAGFEVRTYRLCQRVLMFHHFPDEPELGADCLVRSTTFDYRPGEAVGEFITSVSQSGHRRDGDGYQTRSLPPVEFEYSPAELRDEVGEVDAGSLAGAPAGLAGTGYQWVDLDGEGISGILAEQAATWYYKPNLGQGRFGPTRPVAPLPSLIGGAGGAGGVGGAGGIGGPAGTQLLDLAGDGQLDLVALAGPTPGFFERREHGAGWETYVAFESLPVLDWQDPQLRFVDLNGDGHADVLVTEDAALTWYPSRAEAGFGPAQRVPVPWDEQLGPRVVFADSTGSIHLADMSGDGLTDLVRVRNGEVCYWPNLGYGRFGAKVVMDGAPWFDRAELFDPRFLRLADVDGSGIVDLIYLGHDGARIWLNHSGNGWSEPHLVPTAPRTDNRSQVATVDLFGTGTTCLVWSSDRAEDARRSLRYIDLLGSVKPHLLVTVANNLGAETHVRYAPSSRFYLADAAAGRPWLTRLPFPVHVVERVETRDRISRNRFVTRYAYHHGHFDGEEREFRGFGMVEQWDTEELTALGGEVDFDASNEDPASHVPPVLTKTWFHTGMFAGRGHAVSRQFEAEYWAEPGLTGDEQRARLLEDTHWPEVIRLPDGSAVPHQPSAEEVREGCRALKGSVLRQEIYAQDGSEAAGRPYQVSETSYTIELLQPRLGDDLYAVCFASPRETVTYHYERKLYEVERPEGTVRVADPRISHEATLDIDGYGNVLRSVVVGYGRRHPDADLEPALPEWARDAIREEQTRLRATLTLNSYTNPTDGPADYRAPLPSESRTYELVQVGPVAGRFTDHELRALADAASDGAHDLDYHDLEAAGAAGPGPWRRLVEHVRTRYLRDDLTGPLPPGQAQPRGLLHETHRLAFPPELLATVYRRDGSGLLPEPLPAVAAEGGYLVDADGWWLPSGKLSYSEDDFFQPNRLLDPFGSLTTIGFDQHHLLVRESQDALGNRIIADYDYRVLQPREITDPNRNRSQVAFDALGLVAGTAVMGRPDEQLGDSLVGFVPDLPPEAVAGHLADPLADPHPGLGRATSRVIYDLSAYHRSRDTLLPVPASVCTLARETHAADLQPGQDTRVRHSFSYTDGFEREVQEKSSAPPDPAGSAPRWITTGWTIFNNKGKPARQFEPFFSATHRFEPEHLAGVSPVIGYDPLERVVTILSPDAAYTKQVFDPWQEASWDGNDTALLDPATDPEVRGLLALYLATQPGWQTWHARRAGGGLGERERDAARQTASHAGTPVTTYSDVLGRPALTVAHNRLPVGEETVEERHASRVVLDVEGNETAVVDPLGRVVAQYRHDLLGNRIYQVSMDAGERWMLPDVAGNPLYGWDSRGHRLRSEYDRLRRPTGTQLARDGEPETLVGRTVYGESHPDPEPHNLRGEVHMAFDAAGVVTNHAYDFKGNLLRSSRQLAADYRVEPDWSQAVPMEAAVYTSQTGYDAQNRPVTVTAPDGSVLRYGYDEANLLRRVVADLSGDTATTVLLDEIRYDPRGQRSLVVRGNGVRTSYSYDPLTFRLARLRTVRDAEALQDLAYTYDPAGNLIHLVDGSQQALFFRNQRVTPDVHYHYDARYRLVEASGREHLGQGGAPAPPTHDDAGRVGLLHPGDGNAMGRYRQRYGYDGADNLVAVAHQGTEPHLGWSREYGYQEPSLLEPASASNRLSHTRIGATTEPYTHDAHGNLTAMPHLPQLHWDHGDRLRATVRQVVGDGGGIPEMTWYVYGTEGERVRKVTDRPAPAGGTPTRRAERIYLGDFEIYREYAGDGATRTVARETLHVRDDEQRFAMVETRTEGAGPAPERLVRHCLANQIRSSILELDAAARVISYEEYYPYGGTSYQAVSGGIEAPKRYRNTGKERDEESGLSYHGARYCAVWLGRWISADPAGVRSDRTSLYEYANSNPVFYVDLDGEEPENYYSLPDRRGNQWFGYFLGAAAHVAIAYHYHLRHQKHETFFNVHTLAAILRRSGRGDPALLLEHERNRRPDITNTTTGEVYEIKPGLERSDQAERQREGRNQVRRYLRGLNRATPADVVFSGGSTYDGELGIRFASGVAAWRLRWKTVEPGVVLYRWERLNPKKETPEGYRQAYEQNQWIEVPETELRQHADAVYRATEQLVSHRLTIMRWQKYTGIAIDIVGITATIVLGVAMAGGQRGAASGRPAAPAQPAAPPGGGKVIPFRRPAPAKPPATEPVQPPAAAAGGRR